MSSARLRPRAPSWGCARIKVNCSSTGAASTTARIASSRSNREAKGLAAAARCGTQGECSKIPPRAAVNSSTENPFSASRVITESDPPDPPRRVRSTSTRGCAQRLSYR